MPFLLLKAQFYSDSQILKTDIYKTNHMAKFNV